MRNLRSIIKITPVILFFTIFFSCENDIVKNDIRENSTKEESFVQELAYPGRTGELKEIVYNGQNITVEEIDGNYIFEGDVIINPDDNNQKGVGRSLQKYRWPNNTIYYTIDPDLPNQERIIDAIAHWETNTSLRFEVRTNQTDYVLFKNGEGCSSKVGRQGGMQVITLGNNCSFGTTIHEIGHAIGLWHEQSRADRDLYITVHFENIQKYAFAFQKYERRNEDGQEYTTALDFQSIMLYHPCSFAKACYPNDLCNCEPSEATITRRDGSLYPVNRSGLSNGDILSVGRMYPEFGPWMTGNKDGFDNSIKTLDRIITRGLANRIAVYEQDGYGVVNMGISDKFFSGWTNNNFNGEIKSAKFSSAYDFATGIEVSEQYFYGIIDVRFTGLNGKVTPWATKNLRGNKIHKYTAPAGKYITGIQTREQYGHGIVDVRVLLSDL